MILYAFVILFLIYLYPVVKERFRFKKLVNEFDGPPNTQFIWGDLWRFSTEPVQICKLLCQFGKDHPNNYRLWSVWHASIVCNTPEYAEVILSSTRYIRKSLMYNLLHPWLQTGLLTSTGEKWFKRRKLLTPAFHFNILKRLTQNFEEHNEYLLGLLQEECKKEKTDVMPLISNVALNIISSTSMGVSLNVDDPKNDEYRKAIYGFAEVFTIRTLYPYLLLDIVFRLHHQYKVQQNYLQTLHSFTGQIISERSAQISQTENLEDGKGKLAMLDLLLAAKRKGEIDENGVREEVDTFTFEGHDTVSTALSFALMLIANHKDHQERIIKELDDILGNSKNISYENLLQMNYLELCLKECLRLYPSVPFISRTAEEDIPIDSTHTIPKGAFAQIRIYDIHRNERHWPDAEKFDPFRFTPENSRNRHPYAYIPFSAGPRNCIGQKYAMLEMKSLVATILRHYYLEPVDTPDTIELSMEMVLRCRNGIHVKFVSRNKTYK